MTGTSGTIPDDINLLTALTSLTISGNDISGTLPSALFTLTNLERFYASDNKLSGTLSSSLGDLTMLAGLDLYQNHFSGMIPGEIGHLTGLQYLDLADNAFKGAEHGICAILLNSWFRKKPTGVTTSCTLRDAGRDGSWRNSEWDPTLCPVCLNDHHWCEPPRACTGGVEYHTFTGLQGGNGAVETSIAGANSAIFTVTDTGTGSPCTYAVSITTPGSGYVSQITAPETIVVKGTLLGGVDGAPGVGNDCTLTVAGAIDFAGFSAAHAAVTETSAAGGGTATVTVHSTGTGGVYSFTVTAPGTNYAIGDKLVILGSSFGGVDGTNDCTITTDAAGGFAGTAAGSPAAIAAAGLSATNVVVSGTAPGNTSFSSNPTSVPTATPSSHPTADPSTAPTTTMPTLQPTADPSTAPTLTPTANGTVPTASPTATPTTAPSDLPGGPAEWYFPLGASVDVIGAARRRLGAAGRRILQVFGSTGSSEAAQEEAEGL